MIYRFHVQSELDRRASKVGVGERGDVTLLWEQMWWRARWGRGCQGPHTYKDKWDTDKASPRMDEMARGRLKAN